MSRGTLLLNSCIGHQETNFGFSQMSALGDHGGPLWLVWGVERLLHDGQCSLTGPVFQHAFSVTQDFQRDVTAWP